MPLGSPIGSNQGLRTRDSLGIILAQARVPVVVSDVCGAAASVGKDSGAVLPLSSPVGDWAAAVEAQLRRADAPPRFDRDWRAVAAGCRSYKNEAFNL